MTKIYYESDADRSALEGKTVSVIGFGSQGHAHALNMRESGVNVMKRRARRASKWCRWRKPQSGAT